MTTTGTAQHADGLSAFLRRPHAPLLARATVLGRLATGGQIVALLLAATAVHGAGTAGYAVAALLVGSAIGQAGVPVIGQRVGTARMLLGSSAASLAAAAAVTAVLLAEAPVVVLLAATFLAGVASPPTGSVIRSLVPRLSDREGQQDAAYRADLVASEAGEIAGPVLAGMLIASGRPALAVLVLAVCESVAGLLLARLARLVPDADNDGGDDETAPVARVRVLRVPAVRRLVPVIALSSGAITTAYVVLTAVAGADGSSVPAAVLLTVLAVGGVVGGLLPTGNLAGPVLARRLGGVAVALAALTVAAAVGHGHTIVGPGERTLLAAALAGSAVAALALGITVTRLFAAASGELGRAVEKVTDRTAAHGAVVTGSLLGSALCGAVAGAALKTGLGPHVPAAMVAVLVVVAVVVLSRADRAPSPAGAVL